ncbi:MAG TPA: efflux RND transporter periplasmic adaptor subunit, partial [Verrucomicrobiales bacterium]|nr:efflux RND transporter periplasmic adaptor subunit [Verrucomicrobiales bacterium]
KNRPEKLENKKEKNNRPVEVVFVVENNMVRQQAVKLGISDNGYFEIEEGLKENREIVTGGCLAISRELHDGDKVTQEEVSPETAEAP